MRSRLWAGTARTGPSRIALLERSVLPAEAQAAVLVRAGGNPLYAEEFARLFRERGTIDDAALPESVQGIIAARLDLLTAESKALVQAAAVLGKVFWLGAVATVSGRERWSVEQELGPIPVVLRPERDRVPEEICGRRPSVERQSAVARGPQGASRRLGKIRVLEPGSARQLESVHVVMGQHLGVVLGPPERFDP